MITLTILDDNTPEGNKTIVVQLRNPQGGAEIEVNTKVIVTILENDNVAGVLGFDRSSVLANEGIFAELKESLIILVKILTNYCGNILICVLSKFCWFVMA